MLRAKQYGKQIVKPKVIAPIDLEQYENRAPGTPKRQAPPREEPLLERIASQLEEHDRLVGELQGLYDAPP